MRLSEPPTTRAKYAVSSWENICAPASAARKAATSAGVVAPLVDHVAVQAEGDRQLDQPLLVNGQVAEVLQRPQVWTHPQPGRQGGEVVEPDRAGHGEDVEALVGQELEEVAALGRIIGVGVVHPELGQGFEVDGRIGHADSVADGPRSARLADLRP